MSVVVLTKYYFKAFYCLLLLKKNILFFNLTLNINIKFKINIVIKSTSNMIQNNIWVANGHEGVGRLYFKTTLICFFN